MTDRPILFSAPMVQALLDGRKTQTRRILKGVPEWCDTDRKPGYSCLTPPGHIEFRGHYPGDDQVEAGYGSKFIKLRFVKGDRLWVRESWRVSPDAAEGWHPDHMRGFIDYQAGGYAELVAPSFEAVERAAFTKHDDRDWDFLPSRWRPGIHMPRWASRLTLAVTNVRVERLRDISLEDVLAEGCPIDPDYRDTTADGSNPYMVAIGVAQWQTPHLWYHRLWDALNGAGAWEANPWVSVTTFTVEQRNIDHG